ncbi:MAG: peptidoglycan bridge formation glycyltransferase FemA/FemB family protein [bacterium]|nr:peptidoglycan bridge formation glycyltransferase FemA/FemB family protein [bacterium]
MKTRVFDSKNLDVDKWNKLLNKSHNSSVFNTPEWAKLYEASFPNTKAVFLATEHNDEFIAGLPIIEIKKIGFVSYYSMPYGHYGGVIIDTKNADSKIQKLELITQFNKLIKKNWGVVGLSDFYGELEECQLEMSGYKKFKYKTQLLNLSDNEQTIWNQLAHSTKSKIKQSKNYEVDVKCISNETEIKDCYKMFEDTSRKHGENKLQFTIQFYCNLFYTMNKFLRWTVAKKDNKNIATTIYLVFQDTIIWLASASYTESLKYRPNNALVWDAIKWGCNNGYKYFNFGGSPVSAEGLKKFKESWGTKEESHWFYYKKSSGFMLFDTLRNILNDPFHKYS